MRDRKNQILDVAEELLQTRSFSSFSYQDLSDRIGISKASIHHHFPAKDDLCHALVIRHREAVSATLEKITREQKNPWKQIEAYLLFISKVVQSGGKICLTGSLQAEHNVVPKSAQQELNELCQSVHTWLTRVLMEGKKQKEITFSGTPEDLASLIQSALQGALQQARAENPKVFTSIVRQIKIMLKSRRC